jgi:CPA1 family monovalent cation:H+ antiporter
MDGIHGLEIIFLLLLLFVVVFGMLARKIDIPYPIVLVVAGLLIGFLPGLPKMALQPDLIFLVVLPPLLYSAAWLTSWREFKFNIISISMLAFGLVAFTVFGVAWLIPKLIPGFDWRSGFVLGAVVSTTDAIAATAIAKRIGLPQRVVDVLEGESLLNDASGLLALEFGVMMMVSGGTPTYEEGLVRLSWLVIGGVAMGLAIGWIAYKIEQLVDDGPIEIAFSVLIPYAVYLIAEAAHASGVLAVVACGLLLSRKSNQFFTPGVRLQAWAVWESLTFALNGIVFVLIGLQLPYVKSGIEGHSLQELVLWGAVFSAVLIVLRLAWMFPGARIAYFLRRKFQKQNGPPPGAKQVFVVGWTGMRGVVALAAALSLPTVTASGAPFPQRATIIFLTFAVILVTLVLQGLTLPYVIRALGLAGSQGPDCEEHTARQIVLTQALKYIEKNKASAHGTAVDILDDLEEHYRARLAALEGTDTAGDELPVAHKRREILRELLQVERRSALELRDHGRINDEVLRRLERELDLVESGLEAV